MSTSIVGAMNVATNFRLFLRNYFYPKNSQLITDSLYTYLQSIDDIDYISDTLTCRVKCKTKITTENDINGENVEVALVDMLRRGNVSTEISLSDIDNKTKMDFMSVYTQIVNQLHFCGYLKVLYNIVCIPLNSSSFIMEVYL